MAPERTRRASGMGNIRRYGDGWRAELRWRDPLGQRRFRTKVTETRRDAEAALAEFRRERDASLASARPSTLGDLLEAWRKAREPEVAHSTAELHRWAVSKLEAAHAARLDQLTPALLDSVLGEVDGSPRSRQIVRTVLRAATAWGVSQGLLASDPAKGTRAIRQPSHEAKAWSPAEVEAFLAACRTDRMGSLFLLLASLGLRRGEALALRWSDYDPQARTLAITKARVKSWDTVTEGPTKTARSVRTVPVPEPAAKLLDAHRTRHVAEVERLLSLGIRAESEYVFISPYGKPWDPDAVSRHFARLAARAGFPGRHLHELRHLAASLLLAEGVPLPVISRVLGHSSTAVTDRVYSHLAVEDLRAALEASAGLLLR